tara:strand:- start:215 stop:322 length:108 start_codon:yes stop_codon:yes gene_type:complete
MEKKPSIDLRASTAKERGALLAAVIWRFGPHRLKK